MNNWWNMHRALGKRKQRGTLQYPFTFPPLISNQWSIVIIYFIRRSERSHSPEESEEFYREPEQGLRAASVPFTFVPYSYPHTGCTRWGFTFGRLAPSAFCNCLSLIVICTRTHYCSSCSSCSSCTTWWHLQEFRCESIAIVQLATSAPWAPAAPAGRPPGDRSWSYTRMNYLFRFHWYSQSLCCFLAHLRRLDAERAQLAKHNIQSSLNHTLSSFCEPSNQSRESESAWEEKRARGDGNLMISGTNSVVIVVSRRFRSDFTVYSSKASICSFTHRSCVLLTLQQQTRLQ